MPLDTHGRGQAVSAVLSADSRHGFARDIAVASEAVVKLSNNVCEETEYAVDLQRLKRQNMQLTYSD